MRPPGRLLPAAALSAILALLLLGAAGGVGATPEQIRACVEGNGSRYAAPERAVDAQYADAETACAAAIDAGVVVQFTPGGTDDGNARSPEGSSSDRAARPPEPDPTPDAQGGDASPDTTRAEGDVPARGDAGGGASGAPEERARRPVMSTGARGAVLAAGEGGVQAGSPLPASASDVPVWLWLVAAAVGATVLGAVASAARRRLR